MPVRSKEEHRAPACAGRSLERVMCVISAVVFDLDGVLVDSTEAWSRACADLAARHGRAWAEQDQRHVMGLNSRQWSAYIKRAWNATLSDEEIFQAVLARVIASFVEHGLAVMPGARETVALLGAHYPLAVASSAPRELIQFALRLAGLDRAFRLVVSSDEVELGKPAPDVYMLAASRLGVAPAACVAIEDSGSGIRAAVAAGMRTIAVPNRAYPPGEDVLAMAHTVLSSLRSLSLADIDTLEGSLKE
jgi:HAD superfamily hydrolase (TIGR01509 family)